VTWQPHEARDVRKARLEYRHLQLDFGSLQVTLDAAELRFGVPVRLYTLCKLDTLALAKLRHRADFFHFGSDVSLELANALGLPLDLQLKASVSIRRHKNT
jgi:hypothetical protein